MHPPQFFAKVDSSRRVQTREGVVEYECKRVPDQGTSQCDPASTKRGELTWVPIAQAVRPRGRERFLDACPDLAPGYAFRRKHKADILRGGHVRPKPILVRNVGELSLARR
jgi:hypothetical protein